ncbi:MAG TPA: hypothetical protein VIF10_16560 [Methylobacter sp.]
MNLTLPWEMPMIIVLLEKQVICQEDKKLEKSRAGYRRKRNQ